MRSLLLFVVAGVLLLLASEPALADLAIGLNSAYQINSSGTEAIFTGTLTNSGASDLFLNDISFNLDPSGSTYLTLDRNFFFANVPGILPAGETYTGPIFKLVIGAAPPGSYLASANILGGGDPFALGTLAAANVHYPSTCLSRSDFHKNGCVSVPPGSIRRPFGHGK